MLQVTSFAPWRTHSGGNTFIHRTCALLNSQEQEAHIINLIRLTQVKMNIVTILQGLGLVQAAVTEHWP